MTDTLIIELVSFFAVMLGIILPVGKWTNSLTAQLKELNTNLNAFEKRFEDNKGDVEERIYAHGKLIDEHAIKLENHDVRIDKLEKKK